tara:strand:- start:12083 stop:12829 length:747 start_codon:yes stop_codon:yes gene_type:complete
MTNQTTFPAEEVTLPSKGLLYPKDSPLSKGVIEMKHMTAREEDILTNANLIENGTVIDKLLQSLIITPCDYENLLSGDKNAILIAARILGYGSDYQFEYNGETIDFDLSTIKDKVLDESLVTDGKNEFEFTLPTSKRLITFKFLTHSDERAIDNELKGLKKLNKLSIADLTTRMKHIILSVDGDYDKKTVRNFVDTEFLARDARELRKYIGKIQPSVDLSYDYEDSRGNITKIDIPVGISFFWPDVTI